MKLHWSPKSPYVRKVMILAHEAGLVDQIRLVRSVAIMTRPNPEIMVDNPVGRLPTMVLDNGLVLSSSFLICDYLDSLNAKRKLIPPDGQDRWRALALHALADGLTDMLILWRNERDRPAPSQSRPHLEAWAIKVQATLYRLEQQAGHLDDAPYHVGHIALGCALEYLDFRFSDLKWREARPALAAWCSGFSARPSSQVTAIINDG